MGIQTAIDAALSSIEKRQTELDKVDARRDQLTREIDGLRVSVDVYQQDYDVGPSSDSGNRAPATLDYDGIEDSDLSFTRRTTNAVYEVLKEERPLHRRVILERLQEMGIEIVGRNPADSLSSYMSPDDRLRPVNGRQGYWTLTEEPTGRHPLNQTSEKGE